MLTQQMLSKLGLNVDFVRPRVIDFAAETPLVLYANAGLQSVVGYVGGHLLLLDLAVALVLRQTGSFRRGRTGSRAGTSIVAEWGVIAGIACETGDRD